MSNVGKATDGMLDTISTLQKNRDNTKVLIHFYMEANLINPEVADHLWQVLMGIESEQKEEVTQ